MRLRVGDAVDIRFNFADGQHTEDRVDLTPTDEHRSVAKQYDSAKPTSSEHEWMYERPGGFLHYSINHYEGQKHSKIAHVHELFINEGHRGNGAAQVLGKRFHEKMDAEGIPVHTEASPYGAAKNIAEPITRRRALMQGYGAHGYRHVGAGGEMVRLPKKPTSDGVDLTPTDEHHEVHEAFQRHIRHNGRELGNVKELEDRSTGSTLHYFMHKVDHPKYRHVALIQDITTPYKNRGKGGAERLGEKFHKNADKKGIAVVTEARPSRLKDIAGTTEQLHRARQALMRGYAQHGYRQVGEDGEMVRLPKKPTTDRTDLAPTDEHNSVFRQHESQREASIESHELSHASGTKLGYTVKHYLPGSPHKKIAYVSHLHTPLDARGRGAAQELGSKFHAKMDKEGTPVITYAYPLREEGEHRSPEKHSHRWSALMQGYGQHGYKQVGEDSYMVRLPKKPTTDLNVKSSPKYAIHYEKKTLRTGEPMTVGRFETANGESYRAAVVGRHLAKATFKNVSNFGSMDNTGTQGHEAHHVFHAAAHVIAKHVKDNPRVKTVHFSADPYEPGREKLYHAMAKRLDPAYETHQEPGETHFYVKADAFRNHKTTDASPTLLNRLHALMDRHGIPVVVSYGSGGMTRDAVDLTPTEQHKKVYESRFSHDPALDTQHVIHGSAPGSFLHYTLHHQAGKTTPVHATVNAVSVPDADRGKGVAEQLGKTFHNEMDLRGISAITLAHPVEYHPRIHGEETYARKHQALMQGYARQGYRQVSKKGHMVRLPQKPTTDAVDLTPTDEHHKVFNQLENGDASKTTSHTIKDPATGGELHYQIHHYRPDSTQPYKKIAHVSLLRVPKEHRGHGVAEALGAKFHEKVDKAKIPTTTEASPLDPVKEGTDYNRRQVALMHGYGRAGYRHVGRGEMVRLPAGTHEPK